MPPNVSPVYTPGSSLEFHDLTPPTRPKPLRVRALLYLAELAEGVAVAVGTTLMLSVGAGIAIYLVQANAHVDWVQMPDTTAEIRTVQVPSSAEQVDQ